MAAPTLFISGFEPFDGFTAASAEVLRRLHRRVGFALWMVTRCNGEDWIVLSAHDQAYGVEAGDVFKWSDSFCSRMVEGNGPRFAPSITEIPPYLEAPIRDRMPIAAYIGVPLSDFRGELFGTLCAIDPEPQGGTELAEVEDDIDLYARLLSTILSAELAAADAQRRAEQAELAAEVDPLTGLLNRRGWDRLVAKEDDRCVRYGHRAGVIVLDLDGLKDVNDTDGHAAGDLLIARVGDILWKVGRTSDVRARLGGDEFALLAPEQDDAQVDTLAARLRSAFAQEEIDVSLGWAGKRATESLPETLLRADAAMYADKQRRAEGEVPVRSSGTPGIGS